MGIIQLGYNDLICHTLQKSFTQHRIAVGRMCLRRGASVPLSQTLQLLDQLPKFRAVVSANPVCILVVWNSTLSQLLLKAYRDIQGDMAFVKTHHHPKQ